MMMKAKTVETPTGKLTLWATDKGLAKVSWTDEGGTDTSPVLEQAEKELADYFAGNLTTFKTPLDTDASPFTQQVGARVQKIKKGEVATYGEIAAELNSGPRAVGRAVGANPVPLFIPCHRVMGANGALTGFSGGEGIKTKEWLLQHEGVLREKPQAA